MRVKPIEMVKHGAATPIEATPIHAKQNRLLTLCNPSERFETRYVFSIGVAPTIRKRSIYMKRSKKG